MENEDIRYFVKFSDNNYLGYRGENVPALDWFLSKGWETLDEANRWAAEASKGRMWRIRTYDIENMVLINVSSLTTGDEALAWMHKQEAKFA